MRQYLNIIRTPHVGRLFAASLLARLPMGINGLAIVLMVKAETGSFGTAGAVLLVVAIGHRALYSASPACSGSKSWIGAPGMMVEIACL